MISLLCGMDEEREVIAGVMPEAYLLCGPEKLELQNRVPADCTRIISCGMFGGLAPGLPVGCIAMAWTIVDKARDVWTADKEWNDRVEAAGLAAGLKFGVVPWYSSGLFDEADSGAQRKAIFDAYAAKAIDDETRYCVALAQQRPGLKVNTFRSCSDDWTESLPLAATGPVLNADGSVNFEQVIRRIAAEPAWQDVDLLKVAVDGRKCLDTLEYSLKVAKKELLT